MPTSDRVFDESANNESAHLRAGTEFAIALHENPTTGYRWQLSDQLPHLLVLLDQHFERSSDLPGAGGTHYWKFRAAHPGNGTLVMVYRRSFQSTGDSRQFHLNIDVTANSPDK